MLMKTGALGKVIQTVTGDSASIMKRTIDNMQKVINQKQAFIDGTKLMTSGASSKFDRETPTKLVASISGAINNMGVVRDTCEMVQQCIETTLQKSIDLDEQAASMLAVAYNQFHKTLGLDITVNITTVDTTKEPKAQGESKTLGSIDTGTTPVGLSSVPDANGNTIDLDNFRQVPLHNNYVELNDPTRQKVMFAVGENLDVETAQYWADSGYPLDGFGIIGIGCGESGGKKGSKLIFGTDGGSGNGTCVGAKTINKGVDVVATSLLQTGVAQTQEEAEDMARNDYFYSQLSALVGCARNAKNDGVKANTCWGVLNPNSTNLRDAVPRWRDNYKNGTFDKYSGGTGENGERYCFWSNPNNSSAY